MSSICNHPKLYAKEINESNFLFESENKVSVLPENFFKNVLSELISNKFTKIDLYEWNNYLINFRKLKIIHQKNNNNNSIFLIIINNIKDVILQNTAGYLDYIISLKILTIDKKIVLNCVMHMNLFLELRQLRAENIAVNFNALINNLNDLRSPTKTLINFINNFSEITKLADDEIDDLVFEILQLGRNMKLPKKLADQCLRYIRMTQIENLLKNTHSICVKLLNYRSGLESSSNLLGNMGSVSKEVLHTFVDAIKVLLDTHVTKDVIKRLDKNLRSLYLLYKKGFNSVFCQCYRMIFNRVEDILKFYNININEELDFRLENSTFDSIMHWQSFLLPLPEFAEGCPNLTTDPSHIDYLNKKITNEKLKNKKEEKAVDDTEEEKEKFVDSREEEGSVTTLSEERRTLPFLEDAKNEMPKNAPINASLTIDQSTNQALQENSVVETKITPATLIAFNPPQRKKKFAQEKASQNPPQKKTETVKTQSNVAVAMRPIEIYPNYWEWLQCLSSPEGAQIMKAIQKVRLEGSRGLKALGDHLFEYRMISSGIRLYFKFTPTNETELVHLLHGSRKDDQDKAINKAKQTTLRT